MAQSVLPRDLIESQVAQIDLLAAMYPGEGAVSLSDASTTSLEALRDLSSETTHELPPNVPRSVSLLLSLEVDAEDGTRETTFQLDILVPFTYTDDGTGPPNEPPHPKLRLVQPSGMSKAEAAALMATVPKDDDLFLNIEHIKDAVRSHLLSIPKDETGLEGDEEDTEALVRAWFYFPSISTRSKRDDIINYAPTYRLTGFLLSGKPGVLCLEGTPSRVDAYMKFIKTQSWGDIPAHHKKVSERFREAGITRVFADMQEITDTLGERRGERANRGDMKALEAWLVERGLGVAFMKVLT